MLWNKVYENAKQATEFEELAVVGSNTDQTPGVNIVLEKNVVDIWGHVWNGDNGYPNLGTLYDMMKKVIVVDAPGSNAETVTYAVKNGNGETWATMMITFSQIIVDLSM